MTSHLNFILFQYLDTLEVIGQSLQKDHETNNNEIISEQTSQVPSVTEYEEELPLVENFCFVLFSFFSYIHDKLSWHK